MKRFRIEPEKGVRWGVWDRLLKQWHTRPFTINKLEAQRIEKEENAKLETMPEPQLDLFGETE